MHSINVTVDGTTYEVTKPRIERLVQNAISDFLYYDRKEDDTTPPTAIEQAVKGGLLTEEELVDMFRRVLHAELN